MNYNDTELLEQLRKHVEGELTIPGKVYPDYTKWNDKELNTFGGSHMSRLNNGQLQYLRDMEAMRQDEINHDWQGQWERKLKQDKYNAEHYKPFVAPVHTPKINKRSWLTRRKPKVEYTSLAAHLQDTVGDTQTYSWDSSKPSVASVVNKNSNTTTVTGVGEGKANINAHLQTVDDSGNTATSSGYTTITVTAAPPVSKAVLTSAAFSPTKATFTQNSNVGTYTNTLVCDDVDDGSYTYTAPKLSGNAATGLTATISGATVTITGTPTVSGTAYCDVTVTDSYNTKRGAELSITVSAAASGAHVPSTANVTADGGWNNSNKHGTYQHRLFHCTASGDDGTFTYQWGWDGAAPSGLTYDTPTAKDTYVSGTAAAAGTFHGTCVVTDVYGASVTGTWTDTIG
ncbi:TPA: hypothetical protein MAN53_004051 [Klebsiella pneumoniae]|uniref:hypothetical protein n=1 Tax=Klebsiella pneumoniae TaxID=573 RepID=UPI0009C6771A|nr:hypothetical protein [Klebsiella pneumoniae]SLO54190.1 Uncharacterised protein [Klebsiella pneumoniae]HBS6726862.1 hypothetical protein [Klebsiella pneumoniae]